ncbi:MAG: VOC family protein [Candidatus Methylomirabilis sp.]|nr:VOC family protein [Deltaproteobacteria bacterium]
MPAIRFTHNAFETRNLDAVLSFYRDLCAMRAVKDRVDATTGVRVVWLAPEDQDLPIFVVIEVDTLPEVERRRESTLRHFGFELASREAVDAKAREFAEAGYAVEGPLFVNDVVGYIFMVRDPDGRWVEFNAGQDVTPANWD